MSFDKISPRNRSYSEPNILGCRRHDRDGYRDDNRDDNEVKERHHRSITTYKSQESRPCFNGRITAAFMLVAPDGDFDDLCDNYNLGSKSGLDDDHPYEIHGLSWELVKEFPNAKKNTKLSRLITKEMEEEAKSQSKNYKLGLDFVFEHCIKNKIFDDCAQGLNFLCEIVVPRVGFEQYRDIDLTTITEKTKTIDENIIATGVRGTKEETAVNFKTLAGKKIMDPLYQNEFRKQYSHTLPYSFSIGAYGRATQCFVIGVRKDDIMACHSLTTEEILNIQYSRLERLTINACDF